MEPAKQLRLAVLISGGGTTLVNLQRHIADGRLPAQVMTVVASRSCGGVDRAAELGIPATIIRPRDYADTATYSTAVFDRCRAAKVDLVVLGGFLSRLEIPEDFTHRVINIHPALIPAFCGQGMYGHHVHEAVLERGCKISGCTVHYCDNEYDHGPILVQHGVPVLDDDTPDTLARRVFAAECEAYPEAIRLIATDRVRIESGRVRIQS